MKMSSLMIDFHEYLKKYDYPNIHKIGVSEIADIFHSRNRAFLLSWLIKKINPSYASIIESSENVEVVLSEFVYENGYCKSSEKDKFVRGDSSLEFQQVFIILKMFSHLDDLIEVRNNLMQYEQSSKDTSLEELTSILNTEINLFPNYGPPKRMKAEERKIKYEAFLKEHDQLNKAVEEVKLNSATNQEYKITVDPEVDNFETENLKNVAEEFGENVLSLNKQLDRFQSPNALKTSSAFMQKLEKNISSTAHVTESTNIITTFRTCNKEAKVNESSENTSVNDIAKDLVCKSFDVIN